MGMGVKGVRLIFLNDSFWRLRRGLNMSGVGYKAEEILSRLVMEPELGLYGGRGRRQREIDEMSWRQKTDG